MIILKLKPQSINPRILEFLEKKNLLRMFKPPQKVLVSQALNGAMRTIYRSHQRWGTHKIICVKKNSQVIKLNFHPANEEFILVNSAGIKFRPLCIIIGLLKRKELADKFKKGRLTEDDFIAVVFEYNIQNTYIFTMLADTVHCEIALPGTGEGPVFFVAEPSKLKLNRFKSKGYKLVVG